MFLGHRAGVKESCTKTTCAIPEEKTERRVVIELLAKRFAPELLIDNFHIVVACGGRGRKREKKKITPELMMHVAK